MTDCCEDQAGLHVKALGMLLQASYMGYGMISGGHLARHLSVGVSVVRFAWSGPQT